MLFTVDYLDLINISTCTSCTLDGLISTIPIIKISIGVTYVILPRKSLPYIFTRIFCYRFLYT